MARDREMQLYLVRFRLADGEHIAGAMSIRSDSMESAKKVRADIIRCLNPISTDNPQGNPDFRLISIDAVADHTAIERAHVELLKANPNRRGAEVLLAEGRIDVTNRILHDPEVTREVAAEQTPG